MRCTDSSFEGISYIKDKRNDNVAVARKFFGQDEKSAAG